MQFSLQKIHALQAIRLGLRMASSMRFIPSPRAAAKVVKDVSDEGITGQGKAQMGSNKLYRTDSTTWPEFQKKTQDDTMTILR